MKNTAKSAVTEDRFEVRLSGSGGQGLILAGVILAEAIGTGDGKNVVQTQSYGPEARGGASRSAILSARFSIVGTTPARNGTSVLRSRWSSWSTTSRCSTSCSTSFDTRQAGCSGDAHAQQGGRVEEFWIRLRHGTPLRFVDQGMR